MIGVVGGKEICKKKLVFFIGLFGRIFIAHKK